jgi:AraC-like DNA-binding protein
MFLVMRPTVPAIAPYVDSIWVYGDRPAPSFERVLPTGSSQLLVNLDDDTLATHGSGGVAVGGAALQAPHGEPVLISTAQQRRIVGVSFRPGGAYPFFPVPPGVVDTALVGLDDLWGREGAALRERLLDAGGPRAALHVMESVLVGRLGREQDPAVAYAVAALDRGAAVGEVTDRLGMSRRRFGRVFTERVGLAPKRFARIRRFQRVLADVTARSDASTTVDWAAVAVEHGFCDQSHLIRDFHDFAGTSPTGYRPRSGEARNHVPIRPIADDGSGAIMAS